MSNESTDSWKQRYLVNLERLERQERQLAETEELLRHGIARLCLVAQGNDARLDRRLEALRKAVRGKQDLAAIRALIDGIAEAVKDLDEHAPSAAPGAPQVRDVLLALLDNIPFPDRMLAGATQLRAQIHKDDGGGLRVEVEAVMQLLTEAVTAVQVGGARSGPDARHDDSAGLELARTLLMELADRLNPARDESGNQEFGERVREARAESELRSLARELVVRSGRGPEAAAAAVAPATHTVLLELLNCIALPAELLPRLEAIKERLARPISTREWPEVLHAIASLIADMRLRIETEKSELENFLRQLTDRLQDLDSHLHGAEQHRQASFESGRELDRSVKAEVSNMESSIRQATSLDQLKTVVQDRLDTIRRHMDEHRANEEHRQVELEEKLKHVTSRLRSVEQETSQLRTHLHKRKIQAMSDPLTGIPNRMAFEDRMTREYSRWKRYRQPLTLMILDVDHFKQINDGYGHKAGDKALKLIAMVLRQHLRETDLLARYGGEEFVALLPDTPIENVAGVAEKLRHAIELSDFNHHGQRVPITLSGGYAAFRDEDTPDEVFQRADEALYRAKADGRNRCYSGDVTATGAANRAAPKGPGPA